MSEIEKIDGFTEEEQLDLQAELEEGYAEIEEKYAVDTQQGLENVLVVDNIPVVDEGKKQKLVDRLRQLFAKAGAPIEEESVNMPWDKEAGTNKGFIFLTYPDAQQAENALRVLDGTSFGKNTLYVNRFGDIERFANLPVGEGELPTGWREKPYVEKDHLRSWLGDSAGRDQYLTFRDQDVSIWWNGRNGAAEPVKGSDGKPLKNNKWGELYLQWSPLGTYLASLHRVGVALWSGPKLDGPIGVNVLRFTHPGVRLIQFSPCENYLVTWSEEPLDNFENHPNAALRETFGPEDEGNHFVVWDVKSTRVLRSFPADKPVQGEDGPQQMAWPSFKWSPDDAYVAKCNVGSGIAVYELPGMGLLDKKSIKIEGVQNFEWCPMSEKDFQARKNGKGKECSFVFWTPEAQNQPARVSVMAIPSRNVLRAKNLFNVTDCKFYWQNQGDYLCVKVDRHARKAKSKKATSSNLELFRLREKDYPVQVIEFKDYVPQFAWEPQGNRFAIVSSNDPNYGQGIPGVVVKYNIDFYQLDQKKGDFAPIKHLDGKIANTLLWSPKGRHIALATIGSSTKFDVEFWDLDFIVDERREATEPGANVTLLNSGEHYGITDIAWDPSGRYLATSASAWRSTPEPGFCIWDFKGQQLVHEAQDRFKQFLWRPRPPTLLSKDQLKKVRKELKEFSRAFDEEDAAEENRGSAEKLAQRQREISEWNAWRARNNKRIEEERKARGKEKKAPVAAVEEKEERVEEIVEELIDETEEVVVA
ncbi:eukaryotic translation initiation factor 3 subunit B [Kwoniella heveanensis CBS 569]|uniref:Eukaryotic translation initiation factor 3 subunit B n=2 Tax=Kwoniella heveanensis TaxID=89924 RepID=A0A1B9H2U8_9TREE|nr:Prt1 [Kwoniella heveanensis]OCF37588.1 eukaryotic translation initiation factor 3 subunit B [Kwoniella heveanensis BCC8398]OCF41166.1 eukaryotic translation initiation factor 3 subunit B [Kwoniella heveanensis CBS 569]